MIKKEDISSVTISTGVNDPVGGVIDAETDIYNLVISVFGRRGALAL